MNYLVMWTTIEPDKTVAQFHEHQGSIQSLVAAQTGNQDIKVKQHWHFLGEDKGFAIISTNTPAALHGLAYALRAQYKIDIIPILTDAEALQSLTPPK